MFATYGSDRVRDDAAKNRCIANSMIAAMPPLRTASIRLAQISRRAEARRRVRQDQARKALRSVEGQPLANRTAHR